MKRGKPWAGEGGSLRRHRAALARTLAVAAVSTLWAAGALTSVDDAIADARFSLWHRPPSGRVTVVDLDGQSLARLGAWPWSRRVYADLIDRLVSLDADAVALDVDFSAASTPDGDAALEAALKRADGSIILAAFKQRRIDGSEGVNMPLPRFADNSWPAAVNQWLDERDPDGVVRGSKRFDAIGGRTVPSLAAALVAPPPVRDDTFRVDYGLAGDREMEGGIRHVSAAAVLDGSVDRTAIAGRKVLVGATATELGDWVRVPKFGLIHGVTLHALAAESLLQNRALRPVAPGLTLAVAAAALLAAGLLASRLKLAGHLLALLAAAVLAEGAAVALQTWLPLEPGTAPVHAGLLCFALIAVAVEVDERRVGLVRSRSEAERLRTILGRVVADNFAGIVVVDHDGSVRAVSAAAAEILGIPAGLDDRPRYDAILPAPLASLCDEALAGASPLARRRAAREVTCSLRDGAAAVLDCVATLSRVPGPVGPGGRIGPERYAVCLSFADVTEARAAEARLLAMARADALTGLSNRRVLVEEIEAALAHCADHAAGQGGADDGGTDGGVTALLFFDLDRFKVVNERLGHAAGDQLLAAVAGRLRGAVAAGDLAARLGGDEYAVLARRVTQAEVLHLADAVAAAVGGVHAIGPYEAEIGVSLGVALAADGDDARALMRKADAAMAASRAAGGGRAALFDAAMERGAEDDRALEHDLRQALRRGELTVSYQRQVDLATDLITGVEALVRWRHPERGPVSPARFIPIAERTGLIEEVGAFVLRQACRDAAAWPLPIKVSVNLSAVQLSRGDLVATVFDALAASGLPAERLDLELTESLLMENDGAARERLDRLRAAGVHLSLDDFGTGYSSLSYLRTFAIDKLKIDQSFVRGLPADRPSAAIIAAVVRLAGDLKLRVNAEGCETAEQLEALRELGCDEVQGWFHGRPDPADRIVASLREQRSRADAEPAAVSTRAAAA